MADSVYRTPIVLSADGKSHVPGQAGNKLDPGSIPIDPSDDNLLRPGDGGLILTPGDLISKEPNNPLVASTADGKLKVDANKLVAPNDPLLSVADNKIKSTLTVELTSAGQLILKGTGGKAVGSVTLPVVPGLPTVAEFLTNFTPPSSAGVIGGGGKGNYLHLQFAMSNGTTKDLYINYTAMAGGGDSTTINPSDLIQAGGGLAIEGNKIKVDCAGIKSCITSTVSGNFLANGGLTTDANGKFKVDWTKAPSDGGSSTTPEGYVQGLGTKIGEFVIDAGEDLHAMSSEWVLTDIKKDSLLNIALVMYNTIGRLDNTYFTKGYYLYMDNLFIDTAFTEPDINICAGNLKYSTSGFSRVFLGPSVFVDSSAGAPGCWFVDTVSNNVYSFLPKQNLSTLTITLTSLRVKAKLVAYN